MRIYQVFNPLRRAWIKYGKLSDGTTRILDVKQKEPAVPFAGVRRK